MTEVLAALIAALGATAVAFITRTKGAKETARQTAELHSHLGNGFSAAVLSALGDLKVQVEANGEALEAHRIAGHPTKESV